MFSTKFRSSNESVDSVNYISTISGDVSTTCYGIGCLTAIVD